MRHACRLCICSLAVAGLFACSDDGTRSQPSDVEDVAETGGDIDQGRADSADAADEPDVEADPDVAADVDADAAPFVYEGEYAGATEATVDTEVMVDGLRYPVHIRIDELGIPHVLAQSWDDVFFAQGFVHAQDRFAQMELFRHATSGRLARLAGSLDASVIDDDLFVRIMGFNRVGRQIYEGLDEGGLEQRAANAYAAGVNVQIQRIRDGELIPPPPQALAINPATVLDWEPWDGFSIIRFQQFDLSFDADTEIRLTAERMAAAMVFDPESEDPDLAARAGILADIRRFAPSDPTIQVPGFAGTAEKSRPTTALTTWRAPHPETLDTALSAVDFPRSRFFPRSLMGGFSNSWVVGPSRSANGNAMLANDPHLGLDSPSIFHQIHLVVEPRSEADGPALNVYGIMFPGLPGILIGHNENVAWGLTTASYDYTDAFVETLVEVEGEDYPRVLIDGVEVELEVIEETVEVGGRGEITDTFGIEVLVVPGHGPLLLDIDDGALLPPSGTEAVSVAWRGFEPSDEVSAILAWALAEDVDDIRNGGLDDWVVGTQNLVFADTSGNIFTTGSSYIPVRPAAATDWDPETNPGGNAPWFTLSGTGEHDWLDDPLALENVPFALNPEVGFIVTANNDQTGTTLDNHPLDDAFYWGYDYALGYRAGRITRLLNGDAGVFAADHDFTLEELGEIQADFYSNYGERLTPFLLTAAGRALEEYTSDGMHPDLSAIVDANPEAEARVQELYDLVDGWDFYAHQGILGEPSADDVLASNATSLFNVWATALSQGIFDDELSLSTVIGMGNAQRSKATLWLLENPTDTATFDETTGQSILWDDVVTEEQETRDEVIVAALFEADAQLATLFDSANTADWLWGELHTRTFDALVPDTSLLLGSESLYQWPQPDEGFPNGYPMPGDSWNVDACHGGYSDYNYSCGGGAVVRFLVELDPDGVRTLNQLPGGQVHDHRSPHFRDLLDDYWLPREHYEVPFHPAQVRDVVGEHLLLR